MDNLAATIRFADERVQVVLSPALKTMEGGPLKNDRRQKQVMLVDLIESHALEPALYHNPYFVLPVEEQQSIYLHLLQALRLADQYALASIEGYPEQCLLYPYKDYLMLVLITPSTNLLEPVDSDLGAQAAEYSERDVAEIRAKLQTLRGLAYKAHSTTL